MIVFESATLMLKVEMLLLFHHSVDDVPVVLDSVFDLLAAVFSVLCDSRRQDRVPSVNVPRCISL